MRHIRHIVKGTSRGRSVYGTFGSVSADIATVSEEKYFVLIAAGRCFACTALQLSMT